MPGSYLGLHACTAITSTTDPSLQACRLMFLKNHFPQGSKFSPVFFFLSRRLKLGEYFLHFCLLSLICHSLQIHCWWECTLVQPLWKSVWRFLRKFCLVFGLMLVLSFPEAHKICKVVTVRCKVGYSSNWAAEPASEGVGGC